MGEVRRIIWRWLFFDNFPIEDEEEEEEDEEEEEVDVEDVEGWIREELLLPAVELEAEDLVEEIVAEVVELEQVEKAERWLLSLLFADPDCEKSTAIICCDVDALSDDVV